MIFRLGAGAGAGEAEAGPLVPGRRERPRWSPPQTLLRPGVFEYPHHLRIAAHLGKSRDADGESSTMRRMRFDPCMVRSPALLNQRVLTGIEKVAINLNKLDQRWLDHISLAEARRLLAEGHFTAGSMGPKVDAIASFPAPAASGAPSSPTRPTSAAPLPMPPAPTSHPTEGPDQARQDRVAT